MKRLLTLLMAVIMVFSLFACDSGDESEVIYKCALQDGNFTLKVKGESVTMLNTAEGVEGGVEIKSTTAIIGGKATVSGGKLTADFSGNVKYEVSLTVKGDDAEQYLNSMKEFFLEAVKTDADKKLVNDLMSGKTVSFDKSSALAALIVDVSYIRADVNASKESALFTEIGYMSGDKTVYEYYESGSLKSESYYDEEGELIYSDEHEDKEPSSGNGNESNGAVKPNEKPNDPNPEQTGGADPVYPDKNEDDKAEYPDNGDEDVGGENGGTIGGGNVIIGGNGEYSTGSFSGTYNNMDAELTLSEGESPIFYLEANFADGDVSVKQKTTVTNGDIVVGSGDTVIIDFDTENVSYRMKMSITGAGAEAYKSSALESANSDPNMSDSDKALYRDLLDGKTITFGRESYLYNAFKLGSVQFTLDTEKGTFEGERVYVAIGGGNEVNTGNGGGGATDDPNHDQFDDNYDNNNNNDNSYDASSTEPESDKKKQ